MKKGRIAGLLLAVAAMLTIGVSAAPAAHKSAKKHKTVTCTVFLTQQAEPGQSAPQPLATSGHDFGTVKCPKPFGHGVQANSYTAKVIPPNKGTASGPFTLYFDLGTVHGTFVLNGTVSGKTLTETGTDKVTGGTGAYKRARGHGTLSCTSPDDGVHNSCTGKLTVTRM